jgi:hypothetical protein
MIRRHEQLSETELDRQAGLDRSWAAAQLALADPGFRSYLERSIERVNESASVSVLSSDEFLAQTE